MKPAWLTLIPLNGLGTTAFESVDRAIQRSRVPQNYLRRPLSDEILSPNDASTLSPHCHSPFFLSFNVFGTTCNRSAEIIACWRLVSHDYGPESESAKFYRLHLRLRLQAKRSTPTDSNSGFNSDSAALPLTEVWEINMLDKIQEYGVMLGKFKIGH